MSPCLSFSHPCLSFSLSVAVSLSLSHPCLSSYLPLSHHASHFLWFSLSLSPIPVSLFLPSLSFYLSRTLVSLPISFYPPLLSLFLPLSLSPLLSFFLSFSLIPCLPFYLFSRSLSHPCLSLLSHTRIFLSFSLSLSPIPISLSTPISLPTFLCPTDVSFFISFSLFFSYASLSLPRKKENIKLYFLTRKNQLSASFLYLELVILLVFDIFLSVKRLARVGSGPSWS